jgi:hypothetical protein
MPVEENFQPRDAGSESAINPTFSTPRINIASQPSIGGLGNRSPGSCLVELVGRTFLPFRIFLTRPSPETPPSLYANREASYAPKLNATMD